MNERTNEEKKNYEPFGSLNKPNSLNICPKQATFSSQFLFLYLLKRKKQDFFYKMLIEKQKKRLKKINNNSKKIYLNVWIEETWPKAEPSKHWSMIIGQMLSFKFFSSHLNRSASDFWITLIDNRFPGLHEKGRPMFKQDLLWYDWIVLFVPLICQE